MKIKFFPADNGGPSLYRLRLPMREMAKRGHEVTKTRSVFDSDYNSDVYVFHRVMNPSVVAYMKHLRIDKGKVVVYDQDDILEHISPSSTVWKKITADHLKATRLAMENATFCTYSTPELVEEYKISNSNAYVLENCIEPSIYKKKENKDYIVIGYAGTATHRGDLGILRGVLETIVEDYPNVKICLAGDPTNYEGFRIPNDRLIVKKPVPINKYPDMIADFDIGLVPLEDIKFNACKSPLKSLEYSAAGIPSICSPSPAYQRFIDDGVNGYLAKKCKHWFKYIKLLIENEPLRKKIGKEAKKNAEKYNIKKKVVEWEKLYQQYLKKNTDVFAGQSHCLAKV